MICFLDLKDPPCFPGTSFGFNLEEKRGKKQTSSGWMFKIYTSLEFSPYKKSTAFRDLRVATVGNASPGNLLYELGWWEHNTVTNSGYSTGAKLWTHQQLPVDTKYSESLTKHCILFVGVPLFLCYTWVSMPLFKSSGGKQVNSCPMEHRNSSSIRFAKWKAKCNSHSEKEKTTCTMLLYTTQQT